MATPSLLETASISRWHDIRRRYGMEEGWGQGRGDRAKDRARDKAGDKAGDSGESARVAASESI